MDLEEATWPMASKAFDRPDCVQRIFGLLLLHLLPLVGFNSLY